MDQLLGLLGLCALFLVVQCLYTRYSGGLGAIPGPFLASFSNYWKVVAVYTDQMPRKNIDVHRKYGPVVRIGPNHVSFSTPEALRVIYGSRRAYAKSRFYDMSSPPYEGKPLLHMFSIQDVDYHASIKKHIGVLYTKAAILDLEPKIDDCLRLFRHKIKEKTQNGPVVLNMSLWPHLFAFDCLADINLSTYFGFLESGSDVQGFIKSADKILADTGMYAQSPLLQRLQRYTGIFSGGAQANPVLVQASTETKRRLEKPVRSSDMLNRLLKLREADPRKLSERETIAAVFINIMAGNDVLAVTLRSILYYVARTPHVEKKLRAELAAQAEVYKLSEAIPYSTLAKLPYLDAVIHESLRIHGNLGLIIERLVPPEGVVLDGYRIPGGTVVGINAWVIHRNRDIFGEDVDAFRPERWLEGSEDAVSEMRKNIFSFGAGPRMCVGRNMAMMQVFKFTAEFYRHFTAELVDPKKDWYVCGSWVSKQSGMDMLVGQCA